MIYWKKLINQSKILLIILLNYLIILLNYQINKIINKIIIVLCQHNYCIVSTLVSIFSDIFSIKF